MRIVTGATIARIAWIVKKTQIAIIVMLVTSARNARVVSIARSVWIVRIARVASTKSVKRIWCVMQNNWKNLKSRLLSASADLRQILKTEFVPFNLTISADTLDIMAGDEPGCKEMRNCVIASIRGVIQYLHDTALHAKISTFYDLSDRIMAVVCSLRPALDTYEGRSNG